MDERNSPLIKNMQILFENIRKRIEALIKNEFCNVVGVFNFGSSRNTLFNEKSDLDLTILTSEGSYFVEGNLLDILNKGELEEEKSLKESKGEKRLSPTDSGRRCLAKYLGKKGFEIKRVINTASIPIIKLECKYGFGKRVSCDLGINNITGVFNSELIKAYCNLDERVRPFLILIKEWAKKNEICDASKSTLSSYGWSLLGINFLQTREPPVVPSLQNERYIEMSDESLVFDGACDRNKILFSCDVNPWKEKKFIPRKNEECLISSEEMNKYNIETERFE